MVVFNNERFLRESKEKWEGSGKQRLDDMTITDIEKHKVVLMKKVSILKEEMETGEIYTSEGHLTNIKKTRQNLGYMILLGKKTKELQEGCVMSLDFHSLSNIQEMYQNLRFMIVLNIKKRELEGGDTTKQ